MYNNFSTPIQIFSCPYKFAHAHQNFPTLNKIFQPSIKFPQAGGRPEAARGEHGKRGDPAQPVEVPGICYSVQIHLLLPINVNEKNTLD